MRQRLHLLIFVAIAKVPGAIADLPAAFHLRGLLGQDRGRPSFRSWRLSAVARMSDGGVGSCHQMAKTLSAECIDLFRNGFYLDTACN
jgi:hypothetical protein